MKHTLLYSIALASCTCWSCPEAQAAERPNIVLCMADDSPAPLEWDASPGSFPGHAVWRDGNWKLHRIENKQTQAVRWELYDLAADPREASNLSTTETKRVADMRGALESWLSSVTASLRDEDYR